MMLYYKGCTAAEKIPEIADATEYLLQKAGIKYHTIENEKCCGSVLLRTGFKNEAIEQMKENVNQLKEFQDETIVTSCAGCYKTLKNNMNYCEMIMSNVFDGIINELLKINNLVFIRDMYFIILDEEDETVLIKIIYNEYPSPIIDVKWG